MNPLVEEMLTAKSRQDLEIAMLEELLTGDVKCENRHQSLENAYCSGGVTHLVSYSCEPRTFKICDAAAHYTQRCRSNPMSTCRDCGLSCAECWTITPI